MKKLSYLAVVGAIAMWTIGCNSPCDDFCEYATYCLDEDLPSGCDLDGEIDEVIDDCVQECDKAYDKLSDSEAEEYDLCIECIALEIGEPDECRDGDSQDAYEDCENECEEDGFDEFFEDFDYEEFIVDHVDC